MRNENNISPLLQSLWSSLNNMRFKDTQEIISLQNLFTYLYYRMQVKKSFFGWLRTTLIIVMNFAMADPDFVMPQNFLFLFYFEIYDTTEMIN